jgi:hypothetical protein
MQNITEVVDLLEDKLRLLLERYDFLKEENGLLQNNLATLQQELNEKDLLFKENESTLHSLRVAKTIQGSNNSKETSQKINTLIKEIDLCIAQLSD